tara:strand:- start:57 stop:416 length:360 start_codon:yes stop_codon:yes gene_type:complete
MEVVCSQCDAILDAPTSLAGKVTACPQCGAQVSVPIPASAQVIEVHAEAIGEDEEAVRYEEDPFFNPDQQRPAGQDQVWGRGVHIQNVGSGGGCCPAGCLTVAAILFFAIYGILSFFFG